MEVLSGRKVVQLLMEHLGGPFSVSESSFKSQIRGHVPNGNHRHLLIAVRESENPFGIQSIIWS
jgi:hypothetical protein